MANDSNIEEGWLSCQVDKGMFSDEVAVTYPTTGEWQKSVFVPRTAVKGEVGSIGKVRVKVLHRNGKILALLPTEYQDVVEVTESDISTE